MVIRDHISLPCLGGAHPLVGANDARFGPRFPAVNGVYAPALQAADAPEAAANPALEARISTMETAFRMQTAVPELKDGEVLVRLRATGVCYHDVMARQGHFPRTALPGIIGHEMAGEVAAPGRRATGFAAGDRVAILMKDHCGHCRQCVRARDHVCQNGSGLFGEATPGGYAEYVVVPASALVHVPAGVSYEQAAVVPCALGTAYHGLQKVAAVQPGEAVLITGASGGVGIHAVQVARMLGARTIAVTTSEAKRAFLVEHGADDVIVSPDLDFAAQARALTGGAGVDVVFNIVGQMAWAAALKGMATASA